MLIEAEFSVITHPYLSCEQLCDNGSGSSALVNSF